MAGTGVFFAPQHLSSTTYALGLTQEVTKLSKQYSAAVSSGGNSTRDADVSDSKTFEDAQIKVNLSTAQIKVNASVSATTKDRISDVEWLQKKAMNFKNKLIESRNANTYTNPSFHQDLLDDLSAIAQKLNKFQNNAYTYGFANGGIQVVNPTIIAQALPSGSGQTFDYLSKSDGNYGPMILRPSHEVTLQLSGQLFHSVVEQFVRAQRIALSADLNNPTSDPSLISAMNVVDNALDGFQLLEAIVAGVAGRVDEETDIMKGQISDLSDVIQTVGYPTQMEAIQREMQTKEQLKIQESIYVSDLIHTKQFAEKLERLG